MPTNKEFGMTSGSSIDISVVVVSWNTRDMLLDCLASVRDALTGFRSEIIVVDNASSDGSAAAVAERYPEVRVIVNSMNVGFAKANNIGIAHSQGKYLALINSDVIVQPNCIATLFHFMQSNPRVGIAAPKILNPDLTLQESCRAFPSVWNTFCRTFALDTLFPNLQLFSGQWMRSWSHDHVREVDVLSGCFWMMRHEAMAEVGGLDENFFMYAEDKDLCRRFSDAAWTIIYYPLASAIHFGGASSSRQPVRFYVEMQRANLRYWRKHHGRFGVVAFVVLTLIHQLIRIAGAAFVWLLYRPYRSRMQALLERSIACTRFLLHA
jgi:GT2 family glycosyltransferase